MERDQLPEDHDFAAWFSVARPRLSGAGLWLDGGEPGRQDSAEFATADLRVLLCRLSTYADVLPSITHRLLYWAVRQVEGTYVDVAFLPPAADADILKRDHVPWWLASGCKRQPCEFDVVAVSISVPQEALNLPAALAFSGIPLEAAQRLAQPAQPWVVLGGNAAGAVPFLHGDAGEAGGGGLVDIVCFGDGVGWLQEFLSAWRIARGQGVSKRAFLADLAGRLPGTYIPSLVRHRQDTTTRRLTIHADSPGVPVPTLYRCEPHRVWLGGYDGAFVPFSADAMEESLPLSMGCAYRCRFCQTGWQRGPLTVSEPGALAAAALRVKCNTAAADLNLLASDACSITGLADTLALLQRLFPHVSVKSLAVSSLARDARLRAWLKQLGKREFSFGVEGVSERLRHLLGKPVAPQELLTVVRDFAGAGTRQIKLFFILTGLENDADARELGELLAALARTAPGCRIVASFTPLFHAPFTPLQFAPICPAEAEAVARIESTVNRVGAEFRWSCRPDEVRFMNLLTRAGRAATPVLVNLSLAHGVRYGDSLSAEAVRLGEHRLAEAGLDVAWLSAARDGDDVLPWDDLEAGTSRSALWRAWLPVRAKFVSSAPAVTHAPEPARAALPIRPSSPSRSPVRAVRTWSWWVWLPSADGLRPDATLARALLRDLFLKAEPVGRAYWGRAALTRKSGCGGWALLAADFLAEVSPECLPGHGWRLVPGGRHRAVVCRAWAGSAAGTPGTTASGSQEGIEDRAAGDGIEVDPGRLWWWLAVSPATGGDCPIAGLMQQLRERKVKFQSRRYGTALWQVIEPGYRQRSGVWATCEFPAGQSSFVLARGTGGEPAAPTLDPTVRPMAVAVYRDGRDRCPVCKASVPRSLIALADAMILPCLACLLSQPAEPKGTRP